MEAYLTQLYVDAQVRARFLADPLGEATKAGLTTPEVQTLQDIDRVGFELAARSFEKKRQQRRRFGTENFKRMFGSRYSSAALKQRRDCASETGE